MANTTYKYLGNYPADDGANWSDALQGVTHNAEYWIFTQMARIVKFHISQDLRRVQRRDAAAQPPTRMSPRLSRNGCDHFGDPDYIQINGRGYLFVPVEGSPGSPCGRRPKLAVLRDNGSDGPFSLVDMVVLPRQVQRDRYSTNRAGWCAISPRNLYLHSSHNTIGMRAPIFRYEVDYRRLVTTGDLRIRPIRSLVPRMKDGSLLEIPRYVQGGCFSPDAKLYIVSGRSRGMSGLARAAAGAAAAGVTAGAIAGAEWGDDWKARHGGIRVLSSDGTLLQKSSTRGTSLRYEYQPGYGSNHEPEGVTYWDTDRLGNIRHSRISGQLHAILLNKRKDTDHYWFKHYEVSPRPQGPDLVLRVPFAGVLNRRSAISIER